MPAPSLKSFSFSTSRPTLAASCAVRVALVAIRSSSRRSASVKSPSKASVCAPTAATALSIAARCWPTALFERGAVVLQALHEFRHRRAMALLPAEHEFGARHGGIGDLFDTLGLPVELDGDRMRRFGGGVGGRAETRNLAFERQACGLERAFRGFDVGFQLGSAAGDDEAGTGGRIAQTSRKTVEPLAFVCEPRRCRFGADIGACAGLVEG